MAKGVFCFVLLVAFVDLATGCSAAAAAAAAVPQVTNNY